MRNGLILGCVLAMFGVPGHTLKAQSPVSDQVARSTSSQEATAVLAGTVRDSSGAVIVGATVKVHDSANRTIVATTDGSGRYVVSGLTPGPGEVSVTAVGFADFATTSVLLTAKETASLDAEMKLVGSATSVEVTTGRATQVETENAELSGTLSREQMVSFGLNGRNFSALITLAPGVSNQTGQDEAKVGVVGSAKFSVNGGRTEYNTFNIDGNDVLNTDIAASHGHSTLLVYPSLDSIQEMKVLTSNYGAQYGRSASGTVLVAIRPGADQFHGNAYEFIRNEAFNSRNYFDAAGKAPLYRRQDFGFTIGGPLFIPHLYHPQGNKTFFFISEEWRKERTPVEFNQGVPTDAERGYNLATQSYSSVADFSDVCPTSVGATIPFSTAKYPDCPGAGFGGTKYTYPSNQFYIDPNAKAILQNGLISRANTISGCNSSIFSCYVGSVSPATDYREDLLRIDHTINDRWKLFATGVHDHWTTVTAVPQWANYVNSFPSVMNSFLGPGISGIVHLTTVVTPTLLNDFSVGATAQRISLEDIPGPGVSLDRSALGNVQDPMGSFFQNCSGGASGPNSSCIGGKFPGLVFSGTNAEYGGAGFNVDTSYMPWFSSRVVGTITDNVSKYLGRHTLQFGAQLVGARRNEFGAANGANSGDVQGVLTFRNVSTLNTTGNAFADFEYNNSSPSYSPLSGGQNVYSYQQDNTQATYKVFYWTLEPFFQDDFKVTPRLTVNVGLRLSLFDNWEPVDNVLYNWDPKAFNPSLTASHNISINPLQGYLQDATTFRPIPINTTNLNPVLTNGLVQCGANGVPGSCQTSHLFNAAPRVGLAWDPTGSGKTSIRAGYGVFFEHGTGSEGNVGSLMSNPPQTLSMTEEYPANYASIGSVGVPGTSTYSRIQSPLNVVSIPTQTVWPYVQQWSFGVQREIARDTEVGIAYVGSKGTHLAIAMQLNQLPPVPAAANPFGQHEPITQDLCLRNQIDPNNLTSPLGYFAFGNTGPYLYYGPNPAGQPYNPTAFTGLVAACNGTQGINSHPSIAYGLNYLRPDQGISNVLAIRNAASSKYNSLQFTVRHVHAPLDLTLSYTYSHSIDSASDRFSSTFVDSYNLAANRASSDFDQRHLLNVSYIYQLPLLRLAQFLGDPKNWVPWGSVSDADHPSSPVSSYNGPSSITRMLLGSWSLSGITTFQTGTPFSVINSASSNGISVIDNAGLALGEGADSYPDVIPSTGSPCSRMKGTGTVGPIIRNSCQFVAPRGLTQGNAGRNYLNNPTRTNFDVALLKDIKMWHEMSLQFRAESFNVFNHTQFILYDANRGNTSSNTVSCYGDATTGYSAGAATCADGNGFLHPIAAHRPRTIQFGLKLQY